jgi:hypothetical protein
MTSMLLYKEEGGHLSTSPLTPQDSGQCPQNCLIFERNKGRSSVPTVIRKDTPRRPPRPEAKAKLLKENIGLLRGEVVPGRKTSLGWPLLRIKRRTRMDQVPFYWAPRSLWSK